MLKAKAWKFKWSKGVRGKSVKTYKKDYGQRSIADSIVPFTAGLSKTEMQEIHRAKMIEKKEALEAKRLEAKPTGIRKRIVLPRKLSGVRARLIEEAKRALGQGDFKA